MDVYLVVFGVLEVLVVFVVVLEVFRCQCVAVLATGGAVLVECCAVFVHEGAESFGLPLLLSLVRVAFCGEKY